MVPNKADADFICKAREGHWDGSILRMDWKAFGKQVSAVRKEKRCSQDVAAEMCGISRNYMSMIERGTATDPGYMVILMLCLWLGLELPKPIGWIG
jgi:DNA-binding XRE family transcriptional regulator